MSAIFGKSFDNQIFALQDLQINSPINLVLGNNLKALSL